MSKLVQIPILDVWDLSDNRSAVPQLQSEVKLLFVTGMGGAGKTTISATCAAELAAQGKKTLLCGTKGSKLAQFFGLSEIGFEPVATSAYPGLSVMLMDLEKALTALVAANLNLPISLPFGQVVKTLEAVKPILPGPSELVVLHYLCSQLRDGKYDSVVFDVGEFSAAYTYLNSPSLAMDSLEGNWIGERMKWMKEMVENPQVTSVLPVIFSDQKSRERLDVFEAEHPLFINEVICNQAFEMPSQNKTDLEVVPFKNGETLPVLPAAFPPNHTIVVAGSPSSGKSSIAVATALFASKYLSKRVKLITSARINDEELTSSDIEIAVLDKQVEWKALVERCAEGDEKKTILNSPFLPRVIEHFEPMVHHLLLNLAYEANLTGNFDVVIVDCESGFEGFNYQTEINNFLNAKSVLSSAKPSNPIKAMAMKPIMQTIERLVGPQLLAEANEFFKAIATMSENFNKRDQLINSPDKYFLVTASPTASSLEKAFQMFEHLNQPACLVINKTGPSLSSESKGNGELLDNFIQSYSSRLLEDQKLVENLSPRDSIALPWLNVSQSSGLPEFIRLGEMMWLKE